MIVIFFLSKKYFLIFFYSGHIFTCVSFLVFFFSLIKYHTACRPGDGGDLFPEQAVGGVGGESPDESSCCTSAAPVWPQESLTPEPRDEPQPGPNSQVISPFHQFMA